MDKVLVRVPSSTANVGLGFDIWSIALQEPRLFVYYTKTPQKGIEIEVRSQFPDPEGKKLGEAGRIAMENFFREFGIEGGCHILYQDTDYKPGGQGRSGAEAAGVIIGAMYVHGIQLTREKVIRLAAVAEPGNHLDNVAASVNGGLNIITFGESLDEIIVDNYDVPENLGIYMCISPLEKKGGTEAARNALPEKYSRQDVVFQTGRVSSVTAALVTGNVNRLLQLAYLDRIHEIHRANAGIYGDFNGEQFMQLKRELYEDHKMCLVASGAGPNMAVYFDKNAPASTISAGLSQLLIPQFKLWGINMAVQEANVAKFGAYDMAAATFLSRL